MESEFMERKYDEGELKASLNANRPYIVISSPLFSDNMMRQNDLDENLEKAFFTSSPCGSGFLSQPLLLKAHYVLCL